MENVIKRIEEKKRKLDSYRPFPPELIKNLDEWFNVDLTYNSNAIEGNTLTKQETALILEKGLTIGGKTLKEHLEAINHAIALDFIKICAQKTKNDITLNDILEIHRIILKGIDDVHAGTFRKIPVSISGSDIRLPSPLKIPELMENFIKWLHESTELPITLAAHAHFKIVEIHPFIDRNGRTARLFMNLLLIQAGYPPASIEAKNRSEYVKAIAHAEKTNELQSFYEIIYHAIERSLDKYLEAIELSVIA